MAECIRIKFVFGCCLTLAAHRTELALSLLFEASQELLHARAVLAEVAQAEIECARQSIRCACASILYST